MKLLSIITVFIIFVSFSYSQEISVTTFNPPVEVISNGDWGVDLLAFGKEPTGKSGSVYRVSNTTLYLAVPDSTTAAGRLLTIFSSTNNGNSWSVLNSFSAADNYVDKAEMHRAGNDSVYCIFRTGRGALAGNVYIYNVGNNNFRSLLTGSYRDFSAWASSTGGLYLFVDSLGSNNLVRYSSIDGYANISQRGLVSSTAAHVQISKSSSGDTAILMYYQTTTGFTDTTALAITVARYRESGSGLLSSVAFLTGLIPVGATKDQFGAAFGNGIAWVMYTSGSPGSRDITVRISTNAGLSYGSDVPFANNAADEYWFDLKSYTFGGGGMDAVYYSDGPGGPNPTTDNISYSSAANTSPSTFTAPVIVSDRTVVYQSRNYMPTLVEYYNTDGDLGFFYVGLDGSDRKLYFDRLGAVVGISGNQELPFKFVLSQNYPNPFNPSTTIKFALPNASMVKLAVYDILGREVTVILNEFRQAGKYEANFNASALASGVYFYRIEAGDFREVKKMLLVK